MAVGKITHTISTGGTDMTFTQLLKKAKALGMNLAETAIGRMMDIIEEETGRFPDWDDKAPEWVIKNVLGG